MNMRIDREIDDGLLGLDSGLFDRLPPVGRVTLPSSRPRDLDYEVMGLHTNLFDTLPPVADVRLDPLAPNVAGVRLDTFAPQAADVGLDTLAPVAPAPSESRRTNTAAEVIAGATLVGMLLGAGLFWIGVGVTAAAPPSARAVAAAPAALTPPATPAEVVQQAIARAAPTPTPLLATAPPSAPPRAHTTHVSAPSTPRVAVPPPSDLELATSPSDPEAEPPLVTLPPALDEAAAATAIAFAATRAADCLAADDGRRTMPVSVTFAPSGRATQAVLRGGPLLGTDEGACVVRALRGATVGAFDGTHTKVSVVIHAR